MGAQAAELARLQAGRASSTSGLDRIRRGRDLKAAAQQFESIFLEQLMGEMRKSIPDGGLLPKSMSQDIYTEMLDRELCQRIASGGRGLGLAEVITRQLGGEDEVAGSSQESWREPMVGELVQGFSEPIDLGEEIGLSTGLRIGADPGAPVRCPATGRVSEVLRRARSVSVRLSQPDGFETTLDGLQDVLLEVGDTVPAGALVGRLAPGAGGDDAPGTLLYTVTLYGEPVDPRSLETDASQKGASLAQGLARPDDV